jgi:hypothetical protein
MYQEDLFIESDFSCNKSSYSLREDSLSQIFKLLYKFFNPIHSNCLSYYEQLPLHIDKSIAFGLFTYMC